MISMCRSLAIMAAALAAAILAATVLLRHPIML